MAEGSGATSNLVGLSADIVAAYVTKNHIQKDELPALIATVHEALRSAAIGVTEPPKPEPVIPPNKSVRPDHIVCLFDGKKFKSLKRHLRTNHNMTPQEYRRLSGCGPITPWWLRPTRLLDPIWPGRWDWGVKEGVLRRTRQSPWEIRRKQHLRHHPSRSPR